MTATATPITDRLALLAVDARLTVEVFTVTGGGVLFRLTLTRRSGTMVEQSERLEAAVGRLEERVAQSQQRHADVRSR